jgi:hypothetical protein
MSKLPQCRICKKRPPWKYKNCPPGICKRCYHKHVWPDRPSARTRGRDVADDPDERTPDGDVAVETPFPNRAL